MGYSRWDSNTYADATALRSATLNAARSAGASAADARASVFTQNTKGCAKAEFLPTSFNMRESRNSEANPNACPIILAADNTGSMGFIAERIALQEIGKLVPELISRQVVTDPHILMMSIGDVWCDRYPIQATQFESDARLVEQLTQLYLEGNGGGNGFESYDMAWAFAAYKTDTDASRCGRKGYIFTFGDEPPIPKNKAYTQTQLNRLLGTSMSTNEDILPGTLLNLASENWYVFHVITTQGSYCRHAPSLLRVKAQWTDYLGSRALVLNDTQYLSEVVLAAISIQEGADPQEVISSFEDADIQQALRTAFFG